MNIERVKSLLLKGELVSSSDFTQLLDKWLSGGGSPDDGVGFVASLIEQRILTDFQGRAIQAGIPGPYMLGPYRVSARLTAGRLGDVFQAEHVEYRQPVSLKVFPESLSTDPEKLARLGREARVALQLEEDFYVVKTLQVGRAGDTSFIAFEELRGETLQQRLSRVGRLSFESACQLIQQAALGLDYLHRQGIVHRDICPANLWIDNEGYLKIMEFSGAHDAMAYIDTVNEVQLDAKYGYEGLRTDYDYAPVQQVLEPNQDLPANDLYSLGCTFYQCLTGQVPFPDRNPVRQMLRHALESPRALTEFDSSIPESVQEAVSRMLAKTPESRFESALAVANALAMIMPLPAPPALREIAPDFLNWINELDLASDHSDSSQKEFLNWLGEMGSTTTSSLR